MIHHVPFRVSHGTAAVVKWMKTKYFCTTRAKAPFAR
jgi:hypothetical protein